MSRYINSYEYDKIDCSPYEFIKEKKSINIRRHIYFMLTRTLGMFEYEGLPDTIPQHILEKILQTSGVACIFKFKDNLYCTFGGMGGEPDYNYEATVFTLSNPALNYSASLRIHEKCEIIKNDDYCMGLLPMYRYYATMLTENEISMLRSIQNSRMVSLISAGDNRTIESAKLYLEHIREGDDGIIGENQFFDGVRVQPYATAGAQSNIKSIIEAEQYLQASWYNQVGLDANYNMKRETLTDSENDMNQDALYPLIDRMLLNRQQGVERVNKLYGTNWSVKLSSEWERMMKRNKQSEELIEAEIEEAKGNEAEQSEIQNEEKKDKEVKEDEESE